MIEGQRRTWVVTGAAGFIGSHLSEALVAGGQDVVALDDLSTGSRANLTVIQRSLVLPGAGSFRFIEGSIEDRAVCDDACRAADIVLHQAALGSIPRSIADPLRTHRVNATGTLNMLLAARDGGLRRFVYASSSSVYGDDSSLPKVENRTGVPLAPYAASKVACEYYARNFAQHYGLQTVGLRYFNVFGPRQDPSGPYAAVIPRWITALARGETATIYGDGETSRDFCFVANVVTANILAALDRRYDPGRSVFNIAAGARTSLNELFGHLVDLFGELGHTNIPPPVFRGERPGDVRHSLADISRAEELLGYRATHTVLAGLRETVQWFWAQPGSSQVEESALE